MEAKKTTVSENPAGLAARDVRPLFVDLDGTLLRGDSLLESLVLLFRRNFRSFLAAVLTLARGRAAFKKKVADAIELTAADVRINAEVAAFIAEAATVRPVVLATAAEKRIADRIAADVGGFSAVLATHDGVNLKGNRKLGAIRNWLETSGLGPDFDYIGDSKADRPIWAAAGRAFVVARSEEAARARAGSTAVAGFFPRSAAITDFLKAMRPHQWAKNVLIFLPLILSHQVLELDKALAALAAFAAFSLCASATYLWNDILDIPSDRRHPRKRTRPFASGAIDISDGVLFSGMLLAVSFAIAAFALPWQAVALIAGYIVITLAYTTYLKEKLLIDAMTLAFLYGYRIMIGAAATSVVVSDWLFAFSIFFFLGLALVKRFSEIDTRESDASGKIPGRGYFKSDREIVSTIGVASSFVSVLIMSLYITSPAVVELYSTPKALWVVSMALLYWVGRVWVLAHRGCMPDDPIVFALKDRVSLMAGAVCAAAVLVAM